MMKQVNTLYALMTVCALLGGAMLWNGCETESVSDQKVTISPSFERLAINQVLELIASGGFEYTWSLEDETIGTLSTRTGPRTVYTARVNPGTNAAATAISLQTVTVTSTVSSGGSTNSVSSGLQASAIATIEHVPVPSGSPDAVALSASPSAAAFDVGVDVGDSVSFTASGGTGSYVWSISSEAFGFISNKSGSQTTYSYTDFTLATGTIIITVTSGSETFRINVTHF
jgi:hypothetical protein